MTVLAQLQPLSEAPGERRRAPRLLLKLDARLGSGSTALVHDLSTKGLLFETAAELGGDRIHVHLPEAPAAAARVVWSHGNFDGCEFEQPIPTASVSAAMLRSEPRATYQPAQPANDPSEAQAAEMAFSRDRTVALIAGAILLAGLVWLALSGHFATLAAIGAALLVAVGLLAAILLYALDNSPRLKF